MSVLTLRLMAPDGALTHAKEIEVAAISDAWREVVAEARAFADLACARIRVSDQDGGIVILTSVAAALMTELPVNPRARRNNPSLEAVA